SAVPGAVGLTSDGREMADHAWAGRSVALLGLALYVAPIGAVPGDRVCVWFNRAATDAAVVSPPPRPGFVWRTACDSSRSRADLEEDLSDGRITVPSRAVVVLAEVPDRREGGKRRGGGGVDPPVGGGAAAARGWV